MTYLTQAHISDSGTMRTRVAQAAAAELNYSVDPDVWMNRYKRLWAAAPGWDAAWEYALNVDPEADPGENNAVISDGMILSQVQAMLADQAGGA